MTNSENRYKTAFIKILKELPQEGTFPIVVRIKDIISNVFDNETEILIEMYKEEERNSEMSIYEASEEMYHALKACRNWFDTYGKDYEIGLPNCFIKAKSALLKAENG